MVHRTQLAAIAALTALALAAPARAQTGSDEAGRNALIDQAVEAQRTMDHARALELATRANDIRSTGTLRGFIAREQIALGRLGDALGNAELCAREGPSEPASRSRDNIVTWCRSQLTELRQRVGRVVIELAAPPAGLQITVAGTPINNALIGTPYVVTPGAIVIEAAAPGFTPFRREITVAANTSTSVSITLAADNEHRAATTTTTTRTATESPATPAPVEVASTHTTHSPIGGVTMAVGAVGIIVGAIAWFAADGMYRSLAARCPCTSSQVETDGAPIQTLDTVTNIGVFGGTALVAVGAALFFTLTHVESAPSHANARIYFGPGAIGLTGSF